MIEIYYNHVQSDVSGRIHGGKMEAWLDLRDETVPQYLANLDELAGTFISEVNALHTTGYDLSGDTGNTFFEDFLAAPLTPNSGDYSQAASYIRLSDDILNHPETIAAGGTSGDPGDSEMALQILALQTDDTVQIRKWVIEDRGATRSSSLQIQDHGRLLPHPDRRPGDPDRREHPERGVCGDDAAEPRHASGNLFQG